MVASFSLEGREATHSHQERKCSSLEEDHNHHLDDLYSYMTPFLGGVQAYRAVQCGA